MLHVTYHSIDLHPHDAIQSRFCTVQIWIFPPRVTVGKMPLAKRKPHKQRSKDLIGPLGGGGESTGNFGEGDWVAQPPGRAF